MSTPAAELPELLTCDDPRVRACTAGGVDHDYRPYRKPAPYTFGGKITAVAFLPAVENPAAPTAAEIAAAAPLTEAVSDVRFDGDRVYLRCVWCHGVTCGNAEETDPCIEPYHHRVPHRTRLGVTWPIGGVRPDPTPKGARP